MLDRPEVVRGGLRRLGGRESSTHSKDFGVIRVPLKRAIDFSSASFHSRYTLFKTFFVRCAIGVIENRKSVTEATTILGPDGVSKFSEPVKPKITANTPTIEDSIIIWPGEVDIRLAVAAGMINNDVINSTPTILIATAMTDAIKSIKIISAR